MTLNPNANCDGSDDTSDIPGVADITPRVVPLLSNAAIAEQHPEQRDIWPSTERGKRRETVEHPKPKPRWAFGQLVSWAAGFRVFGTSNVHIFGREWGEHLKQFNKPIWVYHVKPRDFVGEAHFVAEDQLSQIS